MHLRELKTANNAYVYWAHFHIEIKAKPSFHERHKCKRKHEILRQVKTGEHKHERSIRKRKLLILMPLLMLMSARFHSDISSVMPMLMFMLMLMSLVKTRLMLMLVLMLQVFVLVLVLCLCLCLCFWGLFLEFLNICGLFILLLIF